MLKIRAKTRKFPQLCRFSSAYPFKNIEEKWQKAWKTTSFPLEKSPFSQESQQKPKFYCLSQFPYPSGNLHMGHARVYYISDVIARFERMRGKNVFHPMGWDAFGLPAENAAIERKIDPKVWTEQNIKQMREQMDKLGVVFHWEHELSTHHSDYYKWTQYIFLKLYEHDFAYKALSAVNWDPVDQTVLANEQIDENGRSWRSGAIAEQKKLSQWFVKTTKIAELLNKDLEFLKEWPAVVKEMQRNWIGIKPGHEILFEIRRKSGESQGKTQENPAFSLKIFTTRLETLFGVTFLAVSADFEALEPLLSAKDREKVQEFREKSRVSEEKAKAGALLESIEGVHPLSNEKLPVFVANYVVKDVGTGAIMGVPAHDSRDQAFAQLFGINSKKVLEETQHRLINSGEFSGKSREDAVELIAKELSARKVGSSAKFMHIKDWLISRQRYWGAPIPIVYCEKCGVLPVSYADLPVKLSEKPQKHAENAECPRCRGPAIREKDTLDTFFDSSWYFLRFLSANDPNSAISRENVEKWMPVDVYIGGMEHAILHLLYARFMHKFLAQIHMFRGPTEPFRQLITQGLVKGRTYRLKTNGKYVKNDEIKDFPAHLLEVSQEKMSKSKGNGVNPLEIVEKFGSDCLRMALLFAGPNEKDIVWDPEFPKTLMNFLNKVWTHSMKIRESLEKTAINAGNFGFQGQDHRDFLEKFIDLCESTLNSLQKSERDLHVAIARLMEMTNLMINYAEIFPQFYVNHCIFNEFFIFLAYPLAPHITSELFQRFAGFRYFFEEMHGEKPGNSREIHEFQLPNIDFLRKLAENHLLKTKIFINNRFRGVLQLTESEFNNTEEFYAKIKGNPELDALKLSEIQIKQAKFIRQKEKNQRQAVINIINIEKTNKTQ